MVESNSAKLRSARGARAKPERAKPERGKSERAGAKVRSKTAPKEKTLAAPRSRLARPAPSRPAAKSKALTRSEQSPRDVKARKSAPLRAKVPPLSVPTPAATPRRRGLPKTRLAEAAPAAAPSSDSTALALTEEERIESSKYDVRERPRRVFEEERFLFPETYETDRVRLLVKDPEWLFAHWDVSPGSMQRLRDDLGERAMALSRLTLKVEDPADSALSVVLLPEGARSWYLRTHVAHRAYRAQLGLTMPSGEFRPLATSNVVVAPRVGPSPLRAKRRVAFARANAEQAAAELGAAAAAASRAGHAAEAAGSRNEGATVDYVDAAAGPSAPERNATERGEASGELGPGGASDTFRR